MRRFLAALVALASLSCFADADLYIDLTYFKANPATNRWTTLQWMNPVPGNLYNYTSTAAGGFWVSNATVGDIVGTVKQKGTASEIRFQVTIGDDDTGTLYASNITSVLGIQTYPSTARSSYSIAAANNRFARIGSGGLAFTPQLGSLNLSNWSALDTNVLSGLGGSVSASEVAAIMATNKSGYVNGTITNNTTGNATTATSTAFTDTYKAWVSAAGSDTTGTVGKRELPFLTVSNAVQAVKSALGSSTSRGVVLVGAGVFGEYWVNLQRTNLPGISLIGVSPQATMLTSTGTSYLTNLGPLVVLGHNSTVANLSISNNINAGYKQAAIGWDASRGTTAGTTFVVPTNIFIQNVIGQGSSDVGYFYDSGGSFYSMWLDKVDFESKWDAFFLSTAAFDGQVKITKSSIRVYQPDDYGFPDGGSGNGRARAIYVGEGYLTIADSSVIAIGGANTVNETTALTHFGSTEGYTNMNTALSASSTGAGAVTLEYYSSNPNYVGKVTPSVITTNEPYANSVPLATSYRTAKQINLFTNQNNWSGSNYWSGLTKFAGPVGIANLTATDGSTWSLNNLVWSMSSGKMAINGGAINYTNDPNGLTSWYDVNATDYLLYLEPDGVGGGPRVYLYNPFGNGNGLTNLDAANIASGTVAPARLGSGSSITTKYLRGDSTWQTISGGGDALTSGNLSQFAATTSAQLGGVLSDESGSGVFPMFSLTGLAAGQTVAWSGSAWTNGTPAGGSTFTLTMNPNQFAQAGGTTNIKSGATVTNINQWGNFVLRSEDASNDITVTNHSQKLKINSTANPYTADTEIGEDIKARTFYGGSNNITGGISAGSITVGTSPAKITLDGTTGMGGFADTVYLTNVTASRMAFVGPSKAITNAGASGAVPINADGSASTSAQVGALFTGGSTYLKADGTTGAGGSSSGGSSNINDSAYTAVINNVSVSTNFSVDAVGLGTTITPRAWVSNSTAAAAGAQQVSPAFMLGGQGWKTTATAASQPVAMGFYTLPVQGSTAPTANLHILKSINGATPTTVGNIDDSGNLSLSGFMVSGGIVQAGSGGNVGIRWNGGSRMYSPENGTIQLSTSTDTVGFNLLAFGGGGSQALLWNSTNHPALRAERRTNYVEFGVRRGTNLNEWAHIAAAFVMPSNSMSIWPTAPARPGDAYWGNSNGTIYLLQSGTGNTWISTNKIGN